MSTHIDMCVCVSAYWLEREREREREYKEGGLKISILIVYYEKIKVQRAYSHICISMRGDNKDHHKHDHHLLPGEMLSRKP